MDNWEFSDWIRWVDRNNLSSLDYPGVYALAILATDLSGQTFDWQPEIAYIGMTNSRGGLRSRLKQFDNAVNWKEGHGGASRVRYKYKEYSELVPNLYVSVCSVKCNVKSNTPLDLRLMGEVAKFEYECLARFVEKFGRLPEFNDKKRSPKARRTSIQ